MPFFCLHKHNHAARGRSDSERPLLFKLIFLIIAYFCIELPLTKAKVNSRVCEAHGFKKKKIPHSCMFCGKLSFPFFSQLFSVFVEDHILWGLPSPKEKKQNNSEKKNA